MKSRAEKMIALENLRLWREECRQAGRTVVVTNGVYDLIHRGHVDYLEQAASLGDELLVLVNDDASVTALKGPSRPIMREEDRAMMLAALQCVSAVCIFKGPRATAALREVAPDIYVKGGDYTVDQLPLEERQAVQECGGQIRVLRLVPGCSTTNIVKQILDGGPSPWLR